LIALYLIDYRQIAAIGCIQKLTVPFYRGRHSPAGHRSPLPTRQNRQAAIANSSPNTRIVVKVCTPNLNII
jgi:hypothetical protein